jgi:uncharacterized protein involved in type VI secretion and phage assembly
VSSNVVKPRIEIADSPIDPAIDLLIEQIVVDDSRTLPDMFTLRFRDPDHTVLEKSGLKIGTKVRIFGGRVGGAATILLIYGEVTALEAEIDETGTHVIVRGYDVSHRLQRGVHTQTFVDTSEGEIVRRVAEAAGLELGEIEDPPTTQPFVSQANQTDYDFLRSRAREVGYDLAVRGNKLYFQPPTDSSTAPAVGTLQTADSLTLTFGANLTSFSPRITAAEQVAEVEVRGWDPDQQQVVMATADASTTSVDVANGDLSPASVANLFAPQSKLVVGDRPLRNDSDVQHVANAVAEQVGSVFAEAEGIAFGDPLLRAGTAVSIAGVGHPFDGKYTITASRHVIGAGGYRTYFTVSGRQERSLLGLASIGETSGEPSAGGAPIYGVVIATVTGTDDPQNQGRVKLRFPWLSDEYQSDWARLVGAGAGQDRGIAFIPELDDEVLVAFERGDVRSPFVLGGLWSGMFAPPQADHLRNGGSIEQRVIQSRLGHHITLSDVDGKDGIAMLSKDGSYGVSVKVGEDTVELKTPGCTVEMKVDGSVTVKGRTIEISGTSISIKADGQLQLKAPTISISADGALTVSSNGPAAIKGMPLALN